MSKGLSEELDVRFTVGRRDVLFGLLWVATLATGVVAILRGYGDTAVITAALVFLATVPSSVFTIWYVGRRSRRAP